MLVTSVTCGNLHMKGNHLQGAAEAVQHGGLRLQCLTGASMTAAGTAGPSMLTRCFMLGTAVVEVSLPACA